MFKTELIEKLTNTAQNLEVTVNELNELANILQYEELSNREDVVEFLKDWCKGFCYSLSFDADRETINLVTNDSVIDLDYIEE